MIMPWYSCNPSQPDASEAKPHLPQQHENQHIHQILLQGFLPTSALSLHFSMRLWKCFFAQWCCIQGGCGNSQQCCQAYSSLSYVTLWQGSPVATPEIFCWETFCPFPFPKFPIYPAVLLKPHSSHEQLKRCLNTHQLLAFYLHRIKSFW